MTTERIETAPSHTKDLFDIYTLPLIVKAAEQVVLQNKIDAIVACGHSGLPLAGALSYATRVPMFAVRKEDEQPVAGKVSEVSAVAVNGRAKRWLWVDDCLSSGGTFRRSVARLMQEGLVESALPAALFLYCRSTDVTAAVGQYDDAPDAQYELRLHRAYALSAPRDAVVPVFGWHR